MVQAGRAKPKAVAVAGRTASAAFGTTSPEAKRQVQGQGRGQGKGQGRGRESSEAPFLGGSTVNDGLEAGARVTGQRIPPGVASDAASVAWVLEVAVRDLVLSPVYEGSFVEQGALDHALLGLIFWGEDTPLTSSRKKSSRGKDYDK